MAEHSAVNRRVVGSSPTRGAIFLKPVRNKKIPELYFAKRVTIFVLAIRSILKR